MTTPQHDDSLTGYAPLPLRERAARALRAQAEAEAEQLRAHLEQRRGGLLAQLEQGLAHHQIDRWVEGTEIQWLAVDMQDPDWEPDEEWPVLDVDGLLLMPCWHQTAGLALVRRCPVCELLVATAFSSLASLGLLIADEANPFPQHRTCPGRALIAPAGRRAVVGP